jgi:hypothetical protein
LGRIKEGWRWKERVSQSVANGDDSPAIDNRHQVPFRAADRTQLTSAPALARPRPVIEGEHYLAITQEIVGLEVLEPEARSSSGIDFNDARDPEKIGIAGACPGIGCRCKCS